MRRVVAYAPDLMDRSRIAAVADVVFVSEPGELVAAQADVVVVDLARAGVLEALHELRGTHTIGFGSHVDTDLLEAARAAGCEEVLPRSRFFTRLAELLG